MYILEQLTCWAFATFVLIEVVHFDGRERGLERKKTLKGEWGRPLRLYDLSKRIKFSSKFNHILSFSVPYSFARFLYAGGLFFSISGGSMLFLFFYILAKLFVFRPWIFPWRAFPPSRRARKRSPFGLRVVTSSNWSRIGRLPSMVKRSFWNRPSGSMESSSDTPRPSS